MEDYTGSKLKGNIDNFDNNDKLSFNIRDNNLLMSLTDINKLKNDNIILQNDLKNLESLFTIVKEENM